MHKPTLTPETFGDQHREATWLHLYCTVCGQEREFDVMLPAPATRPHAFH
jgi:hypothetical protein